MSYTSYANYVIWFSDLVEYNAAVALCGGTGYGHGPFSAASTFGIAWPPASPLIEGPKGIYTCSYSIGLDPGSEIFHPRASGVYLSSFVDSVLVPGQNPSMGGPAGPDCILIWWGNIIYNPTGDVVASPPATPISRRRFIIGFESSGSTNEGVANATNGYARSSSRTIEGMGMHVCGDTGSFATEAKIDTFDAALTVRDSWERFYIRIKQYGTNELWFWRTSGSISPNAGARLKLDNATGLINAYNSNNLSVETLRATTTTPLAVNTWYKLDILVRYSAAAADYGQLRVYINGVKEIDFTQADGVGLDQVQFHDSSKLGQQSSVESDWIVDFDDWINADIPNVGGIESLTSLDWQVGSHVKKIDLGTSVLTNYTGTPESLNQSHAVDNAVSSSIASITALATIETLSLLDNIPDAAEGLIGHVSAILGVNSHSTALVTSRIGYRVAGGAIVWYSASYETTTRKWFMTQFSPSGNAIPQNFVPFYLEKEKSNDAVRTNTIYSGGLEVEFLGMWGAEDYVGQPPYTNYLNLHNCRYPRIPQAVPVQAGVPTASVFAVGGTYVGNGTEQTINLPGPAHFIWIRGTTVAAKSVKWFATSLGAHTSDDDGVIPNYVTRAFIDSTGQAQFRVAGSGSVNNQAGVTYQYIAFCDPGNRFNICGAFVMPRLYASFPVPLWVTNFLPEFGWVGWDLSSSNTGTASPIIRGPGNTGTDGLEFGGATQDFGEFAAGLYTSGTYNDNANRSQYSHSMWRTRDSAGYIATQIFSYVGDGTGSRIINFPDVTGRWPLFAYVQPHGAAGYFRDPSHTGNNSSSATVLTNATDRIQGGGVDLILVGSALNANGVTYEVFIILGNSTGWDNGEWDLPNSNSEGTWNPNPYSPAGVGNGGINFNGSPGILTVENLSGIYTLVLNKRNDTIYTGNADDTIDVKIPDSTFKTGYIGG